MTCKLKNSSIRGDYNTPSSTESTSQQPRTVIAAEKFTEPRKPSPLRTKCRQTRRGGGGPLSMPPRRSFTRRHTTVHMFIRVVMDVRLLRTLSQIGMAVQPSIRTPRLPFWLALGACGPNDASQDVLATFQLSFVLSCESFPNTSIL